MVLIGWRRLYDRDYFGGQTLRWRWIFKEDVRCCCHDLVHTRGRSPPLESAGFLLRSKNLPWNILRFGESNDQRVRGRHLCGDHRASSVPWAEYHGSQTTMTSSHRAEKTSHLRRHRRLIFPKKRRRQVGLNWSVFGYRTVRRRT